MLETMGCPSQQPETNLRTSPAFIINTEIGAVLSVMRRNVRWGIQYMEDEDKIEHSLIKSFKETRKQLFTWQTQWHTINPILYLHPFLEVIQSDETSAPITGVALSSIYKFISLEVLHLDTVNVADSFHKIIDAVTSCRFEVTDPASEEVVLVKILQVLLACMKNKASVKLSNQHVCDMVNTCFQIVHQASSKGELLQRIARQTMHELVRCIFSHLPDIGTPHVNDKENGYITSKTEPSPNLDILAVKVDETIGHTNEFLTTEPYGIPCMLEILQFLCSLLTAVEHSQVGPTSQSNSLSYDEDVPLFSLGLINSVIELGGSSFSQHPELLTLIQNDLFHSLIQFGSSPSPLILSTVCSIVLNLYHLLRKKLKLQIEAFISNVLMRIAQNKNGVKYQQQEVAMEFIVDMCRQPEFIYEMYANYDCDISCSNLFEELVNLLSKSAFPVNSPLTSIHILALEGLIAMTDSISEKTNIIPEIEHAIRDIENEPFWKVKCDEYENTDSWVPYIHKKKNIKKKLSIGADHFNMDPKKGLEFLQGMKMLPEVLDPVNVACFLKYTTGLDKILIGDYLGNHDKFNVDVLLEFAKTFDFRDMNLDTALRVFLETFRLPGEAQKIQRFVEAFAEQFYNHSPDIFANKDAALLLSYSLILLNTDRHSPQVKKKMTEEDFIRNNRRINGGSDLPREYLSELYGSICENEIRMTPAQGSAGVMTHNNWVGLIHKSRQTVPYITCGTGQNEITNEMFLILSGPTLAALSVVLDIVEENDVIETCIDGFLKVAKIASCYQLDDVIDGLLVSLSKFTNLLNVTSIEEPVFLFGNDTKAMKATITVFKIANTYGDYVRSGWRNAVDCILTLHKLGLLPTLNESDENGKSVLLSPPAPAVLLSSHSRKSSGLMGRFSDFLYYDTEKPEKPSQQHLESHARAIETVKNCHINNIFTESKFLQSDSLTNLAHALIKSATQKKDEEASVFCLELLITVTLNNRDRIMLLWENVFGYISNVVQSAVMPSTLVEKAVFGLIRICQRLLPYKENLTDDLLKSLQLILKLDARVADAYCEHITQEISVLVKANARQIKSHSGWRTITSLLSITARHPEASDPGFETLQFVMSEGTHLLPANFVLCVHAARQFAESRVGETSRSINSLDLMGGSVNSLVKWSNIQQEGEEDLEKVYQDIGEMWLRLTQSLKKVCLDPREEIRNHAILTLQNCLISNGVRIEDELYAQCFDLVVFGLINDLLEIVNEKNLKEYRNMEGTVILLVRLLVSVFLYCLPSVCKLVEFCKVWIGVLGCLERFMKVKIRGKTSEKVCEIVKEVLKECLVVMKGSGVLVESDEVGSDSFWQLTWLHVKNIAPDLQTEVFPVT